MLENMKKTLEQRRLALAWCRSLLKVDMSDLFRQGSVKSKISFR